MIKMKFGLLLIMLAFASDENEDENTRCAKMERNADDLILVKIEEDEYAKVPKKTSIYIGVTYKHNKTWFATRRSKNEKKMVYNGHYKDEETCAHASDTLARKLMENGEQNHKLNFPNDITEVYAGAEKENTSVFIGVTYYKRDKTWHARRWSKNDNKIVHNGRYKDEETAAQASDTLARKLIANNNQNHKLNFPNDIFEVYAEKKKTSFYIGVSYIKRDKRWFVSRRSKNDIKMVHNGRYKDEETAAHASDTLARKLMANGEENHKLNFPDDNTEVYHQRHKRKRPEHNNLGHFENK